MAGQAARQSDKIAHGGEIITGSSDTFTNSLPNARLSDNAICKDHGLVSIISGSPDTQANGLSHARQGFDHTSCGALIVSGSSDRYINANGGTFGTGKNPTLVYIRFPDGTVGEIDERQAGYGYDDEFYNDSRTGVAIYPPIPEGRDPTSRELERSEALGNNEEKVEVNKDETPATNPEPPTIEGCTITTIDYSQKISNHCTLGRLSNGTSFPHRIKAQLGLTELQIACNLQQVARNIVDKIIDKFGNNLKVTSGFRTQKNGKSQHEKGEAVDIQFGAQFSGMSQEDWWERVLWIKNNLTYDQMLVEYLGNKPWIHISFKRSGNRMATGTVNRAGKFESGLKLMKSKGEMK